MELLSDVRLLRTVHFIGMLFWVGGILAAAVLLRAREAESDDAVRIRLAQSARGLGTVADLGFLLALAGGLYRAINAHMFSQGWLHVKLTVIAVMLFFHVLVRARAKRAVKGSGGIGAAVGPVFLLLAIAAVVVAVWKPFTS